MRRKGFEVSFYNRLYKTLKSVHKLNSKTKSLYYFSNYFKNSSFCFFLELNFVDKIFINPQHTTSQHKIDSIFFNLSILTYRTKNRLVLNVKKKLKREKNEKNFNLLSFLFYLARQKIHGHANRSLDLSPPAAAKVIRGDLLRSHGRSPISSSYFSRLVINAVCFEPIKPAICSRRR